MRTMKIMRPELPAPTIRMGATTQQFFIEGAEHEATEWKHAHLPPDDVADAEEPLGFTSFDKIPRKRGPLLSVVAIGVFLVIGSVAWAMSLNRLTGGRAVKDWLAATFPNRAHLVAGLSKQAAAPSGSTPAGAPVIEPAPVASRQSVTAAPTAAPTPVVAAPAVQPPVAITSAPAPGAPPLPVAAPPAAVPSGRASTTAAVTSLAVPAPIAAAVSSPIAAGSPTVVPIPPEKAQAGTAPGSERAKVVAARDNEPARRSHALKGFVWSPEAGRLVPARNSVDEATAPPSPE